MRLTIRPSLLLVSLGLCSARVLAPRGGSGGTPSTSLQAAAAPRGASVPSKAWEVRFVESQLERLRRVDWKEQRRVLQTQLERGLVLLKAQPRKALALALFLRIAIGATRFRINKGWGLRAFRKKLRKGGDDVKLDVTIVTTAALPWKTGTAVNALLRAAYLADLGHTVTLCVPWIHPMEQAQVFPANLTYSCPAAQEVAMRQWLAQRDGITAPVTIRFYPARFDVVRGSILPLGDTTRWTGSGARDLCVLEEPEHLNWYHGGRNWRRRFKLVVGVVHTNYISYAKLYQPENIWVVSFINKLVCRSYCDRVVKLSDCLQQLPRATVCNVHGVRSEFVAEGRRRAEKGDTRFGEGAYFIGKLLWAKGYRLLIDYLAEEAPSSSGFGGSRRTRVDVFGDGEDRADVEAAATAAELDLRFMGGKDHADPMLRRYRVFVNPSQTEVLSTTTAEALAMGKFVVIERHPSNAFFYPFTNTLVYETPEEFRQQLRKALTSTPAPLTAAESHALSWAGGTERFLESVREAARIARVPSWADNFALVVHRSISGWSGYFGDALRKWAFESGPISRQRWLHNERKYRRSTDVTEIVKKSCRISPPMEHESWKARYSSDYKSWTHYVPFVGKGGAPKKAEEAPPDAPAAAAAASSK